MEKGYYYKLDKIEKERFYNPEYELLLFGKEDTVVSRTILNDHVYTMSNPIKFYMKFISVNTGFIYGYESGYGEFPLLYKTADAGKTWKRTLFKEGESLSTIDEDDFHMFNQKQGIMIVNPIYYNSKTKYNVNQFDYFITKDGGLTWEKKIVDLTKVNVTISNYNDDVQNIYKKEGTIISIISDTEKTIVLRSNDFGESFKVLE